MARLGWLKGRRPDEEDLQDEIRSHLEIATAERVADGADRDSARLSSLKDFGNVTLTTEAARSVWIPPGGSSSARSPERRAPRDPRARQDPGFSLTVFAVLTLGIGLNATVFTLLKSLALSPLAGIERSASLAVVLNETTAGRQTSLSYPDYQYVRDHDRAFVGLFGSRNFNVNLGSGNRTAAIMGELVTGNYFHHLGVRAQLGRTVLPSDDVAPGQHPVVVLSDTLWKWQFGSDPDIVGKTIRVNTYPLTVVGVAAPGFHGTLVGFDVEVFVPIMMTPQVLRSGGIDPQKVLSDRQAGFVIVMGRLRPGTAHAEASAQMTVLSSQLRRDRALDTVAMELEVIPLWRSPFGAQTYMLPAVMVLSAMGALLLLIVCANITALVLARGISRRGEVALRLALGAGRGRVLRLLLVEHVVTRGARRPGRDCARAAGHPRTVVRHFRCDANSVVPQPVRRSLGHRVLSAGSLRQCTRLRIVASPAEFQRRSHVDDERRSLPPWGGAGDAFAWGLSSRRWRCRCCCWSVRDWSCEVSTRRDRPIRDSTPPM